MPNRPVLVDTAQGVQPAIAEMPVLATSPGTWSGFELEDLRLPAGELPPQATLLQHVVCTVTSPSPVDLHWRENGGAQRQTVGLTDVLIRSQQELVDFRWDKPLNVLILGISVETMRSVAADVPGAADCQLMPTFGDKDAFLNRLMVALQEDLAAGCPTGHLLGESICTSIAMRALQRYAVRNLQLRNYRQGLPAPRLRAVLEYIDAHLGDDLSIEQLAALAGIGRHYFRKLFRISTGVTVHEYVLQARISRAIYLLQRGELSIVEVALLVGFSSQSHLTAEFRRRLGITPAAYRWTLFGNKQATA